MTNRATFFMIMVLVSAGCSSPVEEPQKFKQKVQTTAPSPWTCPTSGYDVKPVEISINKWQAKDNYHLNNGNYANRVIRPWSMLFSQNVDYVGFQFNDFDSADYGDQLSISHGNGQIQYYYNNSPLTTTIIPL